MSPDKKPRTRKPLDDALAEEFVYGSPERQATQPENAPENVEESIESQPTEPSQKLEKGSLMSRLMEAPEKEATVRITVDLPKSMHQKLSLLSARSGKKKAEIIRMLLTDVFNEVNE
jgi:macrodomain Ter protein organizer (MatP/YcbG family)